MHERVRGKSPHWSRCLQPRESAASECACWDIKLPVAEARIHQGGGRRFLLVTRYDRQTDAHGNTTRLHQEDFCQALGVAPEMKYQNEGGPDLKACFDLLRHVTRPSAPQVLRLLDCVAFNVLLGNHDAHAKNFSLLYAPPSYQSSPALAPLYDVLSTAVYPDLPRRWR